MGSLMEASGKMQKQVLVMIWNGSFVDQTSISTTTGPNQEINSLKYISKIGSSLVYERVSENESLKYSNFEICDIGINWV